MDGHRLAAAEKEALPLPGGLDPETAQRIGVKDKQMVKVEIGGLRGGILHNVLIRVSEQFAPEMHIDVDEANAFGVKNGDRAYIIVD